MNAVIHSLKKYLQGDVRDDPLIRQIYSVDASIYEVEPLGVVIPRNKEDLLLTLKIAAEHQVTVTARGAATGITGSCLGKGLIIDTSTYLNRILDINIAEEYAICEPGVVQDRLNDALYRFGYRLGPDTSTGNRATLGGMLANNSAGARSLHYGRMVDHVAEVELALVGGDTLSFRAIGETEWAKKRTEKTFEGNLYREIFRVLNTYREEITTLFPKIPRHVSGYNLDTLLEAPPLNLSKLIAGSEGTLGIATAIKMKLAKLPRYTGICILHIREIIPALSLLEEMLSYHPLSLEMIDDKILDAARTSPSVKNKLHWLIDYPKAVFIAEFEAEDFALLQSKLKSFATKMRSLAYAAVTMTDSREISCVWEVRKAGLGLLLSKRSYSRAIAFIEDISVAPPQLASFMQHFYAYLKKMEKEAGIYGHIGSGCMHIRPYIDLRNEEDLLRMQQMMIDVSNLVLAHGGAMSGEHGDGLVRTWLNEKMFGKKLYQAFKDIKAAFDPNNLMNPGKVVDGTPFLQDLRLSPETPQTKIATFLDFSREGGIELAADLCNGNGQCRKMESVMCPSFQASQEEYHTTRARAQSLRAMIHDKLPYKTLTSPALYDVLDLCIECKGCKRECPSQVDMAKMKSEFLFQYQEKHGYSLRSRLFGHISFLNRLSSPFSGIFNTLSATHFGKFWLNLLGVTTQRELPELAHQTFSKWFKTYIQKQQNKRVVLFVDTYTEYNEPEIGKAACKIFSALGYEIIAINNHCCGRPLISKGFLKQAKNKALKIIETLMPYANQEISIVVLEPSCLSAFRDDYYGLLGKNPQLEVVAHQVVSFDEFLHRHLKNDQLPLPFKNEPHQVWVHGHCHQKALGGFIFTLEVLRSIPGFTVYEINAGCCGMAGSFGYEKEHYEFSMRIAELRLLPAVRVAGDKSLIVADGVSCRGQIFHGSDRIAKHLAQTIAAQLLN